MHGVKLTYHDSRSSSSGLEGWVLNSTPAFEPSAGMGLAHDIIEHKFKDKGTLEDEIQAIGALVFTRIESGFLNIGGNSSINSEGDIVANNVIDTITNMVEISPNGLNRLIQSGVKWTPAGSKSLDSISDYAELCVSDGVAVFKDKVTNLQSGELVYSSLPRSDISALQSSLLSSKSINAVRNHLRVGYRRAYTRFNGSAFTGMTALTNCEKAIKFAEDQFSWYYGMDIINGSSLTVSVRGQSGDVYVKLEAPQEYLDPYLAIRAKVQYNSPTLISVGYSRQH